MVIMFKDFIKINHLRNHFHQKDLHHLLQGYINNHLDLDLQINNHQEQAFNNMVLYFTDLLFTYHLDCNHNFHHFLKQEQLLTLEDN